MSDARGRLAACVTGMLMLATLALVCADLPAPVVSTRKGVKVEATVIRGSKEGEESVDASLGDTGEQLKKKFGLKRVEVIDTTSVIASSGWEVTANLAENLTLKLRWRALQKDVANFRVWIARGKDTLVESQASIKIDSVGFAFGKLDKDMLILMLKPTLDASGDD